MRRFGIIFALLFALTLVFGGSAAGGSGGKGTYDWHIGDTFLQDFGFPVGDEAMSSSTGDIVRVIGTGILDASSKTASGGGTFTHFGPDGTTVKRTGTWTVTGLTSFQFYGCGGEGLPSTFCGGRADFTIAVTPAGASAAPGFLQLECVLGNPPSGASEGIRVWVPGHAEFNKTVQESGNTVLINTH
jgi:hypothetical protein